MLRSKEPYTLYITTNNSYLIFHYWSRDCIFIYLLFIQISELLFFRIFILFYIIDLFIYVISVRIQKSIFEIEIKKFTWNYTDAGPDEQEPATPILSLSHGIFTDWSIFITPFLLWTKGSSGPVTKWRQ